MEAMPIMHRETSRDIGRSTGVAHRPKSCLSVGLASTDDGITAAKKLRYRVFADELCARIQTRVAGVDHDIFDHYCDHYCDHLVARDEDSGEIVSTYRILPPDAAKHPDNFVVGVVACADLAEKDLYALRIDVRQDQQIKCSTLNFLCDVGIGALVRPSAASS